MASGRAGALGTRARGRATAVSCNRRYNCRYAHAQHIVYPRIRIRAIDLSRDLI